MKNKFTRSALLVAASSLMAAFTATAANTFYNSGDLMLTFQKVGSTNTVYADLGSATTYRGAAVGADTASIYNIANINDTLVAAFGAGWASDTNVFAGLSAVNLISSTSNVVTDGDASRTIYVSASRFDVGTIGAANSSTPTVGSNTDMTGAAAAIKGQNDVLGSAYSVGQTVSTTDISYIDDKQLMSTFNGSPIQGTAFGVFAGGIQQQGSASSFGSLGGVDNVEFALDLYRIVAVNGKTNEINGTTVRSGDFEGSFVINNSGSVSFVTAVPEPSSLALVGLAAGSLVLRRRRSAN